MNYKEYAATGNYWFAANRTWERIQTGAEFVKSCSNLDDKVANDIKKYQWVLSYFETDFENEIGGVSDYLCYWDIFGSILGSKFISGTEVSNVTILRLQFISEGEPYNLGVVSNKGGVSEVVGGDRVTLWEKIFGPIVDFFTGKSDWWVYVLVAVGLLIVLPAIVGFLVPAFGQLLLKLLKAIGKALLWVVMLPVRFVKWVSRKISARHEGKQ